MTVARVSGTPDYSTATGSKLIPWVFSKKTVVKFYDASVLPAISHSDYEGEIKALGDKVIIHTRPNITIGDYVKNGTVDWQSIDSEPVELEINKAKVFAFRMDKIDIKQFAIDMMDESSQDAGEQMRTAIDADPLNVIYVDAAAANRGATAGRKSAAFDLGVTGTPITITKANVIDYIVHCETVADEQNWPDTDRWMVIPPLMANLIQRSDLKDASLSGDGTTMLRNGRLGIIGKFTLYKSNLYAPVTDSGKSCYNNLFGHKSALCFAAQLVETEYFEKFENTFGKGMKGLNVYGYKVTKAESLGVLYATFNVG